MLEIHNNAICTAICSRLKSNVRNQGQNFRLEVSLKTRLPTKNPVEYRIMSKCLMKLSNVSINPETLVKTGSVDFEIIVKMLDH